jgi:uncharacterized phage protein gp47/JayE
VSDSTDTSLDNCGCCATGPVPLQIYNRPGLPALAYRAGTYGTFFRRMLDKLGRTTIPDGPFAGTRPLLNLATRAEDDPSIALLDASAIVADVLTFYQERIANEGFLRTATERRSILELARAIGYELNPGVAAAVYLAFTIDDSPGAPGQAIIPAGTKVQSVPPQDQMPQTFETSQDIPAYAGWNALRPRLSRAQEITLDMNRIFLDGTDTNLKAGDALLLDDGSSRKLVRVTRVSVESTLKRTTVEVDGTSAPVIYAPGITMGSVDITEKIPFSQSAVDANILGKYWKDQDLNAFLSFNKWDRDELLAYLADHRKTDSGAIGSAFALRTKVGFFGDNAPLYGGLPTKADGTTHLYPGSSWDTGWEIWKDQQSIPVAYYSTVDSSADAYLDRTVPGLVPGSWAVFEAPGATMIFKINLTTEKSLAAFAISGKVTGVKLNKADGTAVNNGDKSTSFLIRNTTAYLQSESLPLAVSPVTDDLASGLVQVIFDGLVLGLQIGQPLLLTGERADARGVMQSEALLIADIHHINGQTTIKLASGLQYSYLRSTVKINANTASATHGESTTEILGSGDGAQANQRFTLKKPPLTYTASPTPSGSASTLQLRVNNLLWDEAPSLYNLGPKDQDYIVRTDDDSKATVIFGDSRKGARLPTGVNNVVATYRSGIGLAGQVNAGSLSILQSRPLGVRSVTNPLAAGGAADPEKMDDARQHAPLTVRTLDRIVSLDDYQDFASAFAGIGKAQAIDLWSGSRHLVHLTIAGADGKPVNDGPFKSNFEAALDAARDPAQQVQVDTFEPLLFNLSAKIAVDHRYITKDVFTAVQAALAQVFAFARRGFGQLVTAAEVMTAIQDVPGVVFVDLTLLYASGGSQSLNQILTSNIAYVDSTGTIHPAQLRLINTLGVSLKEVKA